MLWNKDKLFCDISPTCYAISVQKEIVKRHIKNLLNHEKFAKTIQQKKLPNVVASYNSGLIKRGKGIDITLQENKAVNIGIACGKINGILIRPGETFSFFGTIGKMTRRKGYKEGRVLERNRLKPGLGGGLCNLGNTLHRVVLHSPMDVTEFHSHSDALAPDEGKRVPFSSGTSVSYNYIDYRFKNNTDQVFQILVWCENERLYTELRSEKEIPWHYELVEEDHHFAKEKDKYYRISKIYRETLNKKTGELLKKELVLDNHSEVMYDYSLIPKEQIR